MLEFIGAALLLGYLPGALLFRLPYWQRDTRAALPAEERVFWHVVLGVSWSLTIVLALAALALYPFERLLSLTAGAVAGVFVVGRGRLLYRSTATRVTWTAVLPLILIALRNQAALVFVCSGVAASTVCRLCSSICLKIFSCNSPNVCTRWST